MADKLIVISSILSGFVTWIFMYLDSQLFDVYRSKFTYLKGILFVSLLVGTVIYIVNSNNTDIISRPGLTPGNIAIQRGIAPF
jgi:hypothetical protein